MIKRITAILLCLCLMAGGLYALKALSPSEIYGEGTVPGSADDPVVTKSYVDQKLHEQESALSEKIDSLKGRIDSIEENSAYGSGSESDSGSGESSGSSSSGSTAVEGVSPTTAAKLAELEKFMKFVVVEVPEGGKLIGSMGTEMILRAGTAEAIDNGADGITDLSTGADLKSGEAITKNHLIIIPRTDGRGIKCTAYCYVMVKGEYEIKR